MSQVAALPFEPFGAPHVGDIGRILPLSDVGVGASGLVTELRLEADVAAWLRAVGISEGESVTVLRCAAFGGPIHVRTSSGGEFALHRSLAASVIARSLPLRPPSEGDGESPP
jgi:ferrous iron transport protein A